jgi:Tfp pilus assembly protein PilE
MEAAGTCLIEKRLSSVRRRRSGYTLLELILALALATVILGLVAMAIHLCFAVAQKSRGNVAEAKLARTALQRVAEDIHNAVPFVASSTSSSSTSSSGSTTSTTSSSSSTSSTSSSSSSTSTSTSSSSSSSSTSGTSFSGGIWGDAHQLRVETCHRVRLGGASSDSSEESLAQVHLGDVRMVTYSVGLPSTTTTTSTNAQGSGDGNGVYRRELDRAEYVWTTQNGDASDMNQSAESLPSEIESIEFTYYDSSLIGYAQWDSTDKAVLPTAVKAVISVRSRSVKPSLFDHATKKAASKNTTADGVLLTYCLLIDIPNSTVTSSSSSSSSSSSTSASTSSTSTTTTSK